MTDERCVEGVAASTGVALAAAWQPRPESTSDAADLHADGDSVRDAFGTVRDELLALADAMRRKGLRDEADILTAESAIADDDELLGGVLTVMSAGTSAGAAIRDVGEELAHSLERLESEYLRERAADVRQVVRRALAVLAGARQVAPPPKPFILIDSDIGPVDLLEFAADGLAGAVSFRGGVNAHAAIVARSLGIPLLIGVDTAALSVEDGSEVLVDADRSVLVVSPSEDARADASRRVASAAARRGQYALERDLPVRTLDGHDVTLLCNIASAPEARIAFDARATGVGLLRTELPFLHSPSWPAESAHRASLEPIFAHLDGLPVTVRLLDFTNDKVPPFLKGVPDGLEALLSDPGALQDQLTALLDVGRRARTRILLPMVRRPEEVTAVRAHLRRIAQTMSVIEPLLGAMIELPEAAERAAELAAVSDFFSLGTNDLTAAVLGLTRVDRGALPAMAAHPTVLSHIVAAVRAADEAGISVSVCGDAGADPLVLPLLLGAGIRSFSVSPSRVDQVRYRIRRIDAGEWAGRLPHALDLTNAEAVWTYVENATAA